MVARRKTSTVKKTLKVPPSITAPENPPEEPLTETYEPDTQMPEKQPFEVKVEVETEKVPSEPVAQTPQTNESEPSPLPEEQPTETIPQEVPAENSVPENLYIQDGTRPAHSGKKWLWIVLVVAVLLFVAGGIYTYVKTMKSLGVPTSTPTPSDMTSTPTPTASPSAQLNRSDLKIQVLNGTSVIGLAARAKAYLEGLGYKNVAVGNAEANDLTETTIALKDTKKDYLDLLKTDINPKYPLSKSSTVLSSSSPYDVVVTLGQP